MKHLGDLTKINGSTVKPVNVIIGGSPCQDLSVAGKRAGLAGERSGLFMEQIRVIKEMRCADAERGRTGSDIRPRWMVWENVPGAFSSNKGEDFGGEITVIQPCYLEPYSQGWQYWKEACQTTERRYFELLNWGCSPQEARAVLPNSLKTEVVMTANLREWRHFFNLRTAPAAHPQMREVAKILLKQMREMVPGVFDDCGEV